MREEIAPILRIFRPKIQFSSLSAFAGNLATCLSAGLNVPESLETSTRSSPDAVLRMAGPVAAEDARSGKPLSESLEVLDEHLPPFFLPVLRCGEQSGRTDEALNYLRGHCSLLDRPNRMMRNMWLAPLLLFGLGSIVVAAAYFVFTPLTTAIGHLLRTIVRWAAFVALVLAVVNVPALRRVWDQVLLIVPYFGGTIRAMAHDRFFNAFNLLYCTGGIPVAEMVRLASTTVDNAVVREDLLGAVPLLENGTGIAEAFGRAKTLDHAQHGFLTTGEEAGKLEEAIAALCRRTSELVRHRLGMIQKPYLWILTLYVFVNTLLTVVSLWIAYSQ